MEGAHPALRAEGGVACEMEQGGEARLLVLHEIDHERLKTTADEILAAIRVAIVRDHGITPAAIGLVEPRSIPRTPSGKKQRHRCAQDFLDGRLRIVASSVVGEVAAGARDEVHLTGGEVTRGRRALEASLVALAAAAFGVPAAEISTDVPLTQFGGDSLRATELQARIETQLGVRVRVGDILEGRSIAQLIGLIADAPRGLDPLQPASLEMTESRLSEAEKAMWFLHKLASDSSVHTIARAGRILGPVDWDRLSCALRAVVARHEALRTTFPATAGQPRAQVHDSLEPCLQYVDVAALDDPAVERAVAAFAGRPFSLEHGPLVRLGLFSRSPSDHVLAFAIHHIVADLWSVCALLDDLGRIYAADNTGTAPALRPVGIRYRDYLAGQARRLAGPDGQRLEAYWHEALAGVRPTELPTDRPRPASAHFSAVTEHTDVDPALVTALGGLAVAHGATPYTVWLAAFQVLVHGYTGQPDVVVGSPFHGRHGAGSMHVVGCLTNLLALRANLAGDPTFAEHLAATRLRVLGALDHQDYPFPKLVEALRPRRDANRMPLCNVVFVYQSVPREGSWPLFAVGKPGARLDLGPLQLACLPAPAETTAFDLTVTAAPCDGALSMAWNYRTDLFDRPTIRAMAAHFDGLLRRIAAEPSARISHLVGQVVAS
jgi:acyl carrier protein